MSKERVLIGRPELMRQTNARTILTLLKKRSPCSRAELARETGMSAPTVGNVIAELTDFGLVEWLGEGVSGGGGGRRPENLRFKAEYGYLAGVHISAGSVQFILTDLNGDVVEDRREPLRSNGSSPEDVVTLLHEQLKAIMKQHSLPWKKLLALTVGMGGITNVDEGVVLSVNNLSSWRNVPLKEMLQRHFSCALHVENSTNLAAEGERFRGAAQEEDSFIFVGVGSGVGAGIILNGQLIHGRSWSAGEIGYLRIPNVSGANPALYEYGRLEQILGAQGILKSWNAVQEKAGATRKVRKASDVLDLAAEGNQEARKIARHRARLLKDVVINLSLTLNPALFVFGGEFGGHPMLLEPTIEMLRESEVAAARIVPSGLGSSSVAWGAVATAMQEAEKTMYRLPVNWPKQAG
ncbi:MAG: ROK family transcriptional regulator [Edaphobacter sp.]|uniref:ROK family transcriptional regulator n=1 Tax=Edaphobacter sp. TaxID=1934404 RepID=UPI002397E9F4|nr:ROK family transcriptional regulator [Edaphobacter sp.]MDE1178191.1 ROK family transcriptional regulator [Edaphobacter sp.]